MVYGTTNGPWLFVPLPLQDEIEALNLGLVSFPGGNWGEQNDFDTWHLDQFIQFCRQMGAEPRVVVRLRGGSPERAAEMVRYANLEQGYGVKYWGIGNEPNLMPGYELEAYVQEWRAIAEAMLAVDPTITLTGPDVNQWEAVPTYAESAKIHAWMERFLEVNGDLVGIVTVHRYPFPSSSGAPAPTIAELRANAPEFDTSIPVLREVVRAHTGRDLPVAVTELNSSWAANMAGEATLDSHFNAIWYADVLGRLIRQDVAMVAQFAVIGEFGIVGRIDPYPLYYTFRMYAQYGTERVYAASGVPNVSVYAARRADGVLTIMVVNLESEPRTVRLAVEGAALPAEAETWLFDAEHNAEQVEATALAADGEITVSAESINLFVVTP
jgi:hypothetical protein